MKRNKGSKQILNSKSRDLLYSTGNYIQYLVITCNTYNGTESKYIYKFRYIHICMYMCVYVYIYMCVCVCVCVKVKVLVTQSVQFFVTPWTVAHQAPMSMGFFSQVYWIGSPCPPPGDLSDPGIELTPLMSPALAGRFFTTSTTWEVLRTSLQVPKSSGAGQLWMTQSQEMRSRQTCRSSIPISPLVSIQRVVPH